MEKKRDILAGSQADQDQEIAAAVEWIGDMDQGDLIAFFDAMNDGTPQDFREMSDAYLQCVRSFAMIGFFEAMHAYSNRTP